MIRLTILLILTSVTARAKNPGFSGADPHAIVIDGRVWIYPTRAEGGKNFLAFESTDLKNWKKQGPVLDFKDVPWLNSEKRRDLGPWAPCLAIKGSRYYFYYSVGPQSEGRPSRIGVAEGNSPAGPFKDSGKALLTGGNGFEAIDPMVFGDPASHQFYFYAGGSAGAKLRVFELDDNMMTFRREIPVATPKNFTEGAFMHVQGGVYHLTYSHGDWQKSSYSVHHATSKSPLGPWEHRGEILKSDEHHKGPGHHSIVQFPSGGDWWIVYHRWNKRTGDGPYRGSRETCIDKLTHGPDGTIVPVVMTD